MYPRTILNFFSWARRSPFQHALLCLALVGACLLSFMAGSTAQAAPPPQTAASKAGFAEEIDLQALRVTLDKVQSDIAKQPDSDALLSSRELVEDSVSQGMAAVTQLTPRLNEAKARLSELGAAPADGKEAPEIARLRKQAQDEVSTLDAQVKLANLLAVEGQQTLEQIRVARRTSFQSELTSRTASILSDRFWRELGKGSKEDLRSMTAHVRHTLDVVTGIAPLAILGALVLAGLVVVARLWAGRALVRVLSSKVPGGRLRRSLYAVLHVVLATLTPLVLLEVLALGLSWLAPASNELQPLLRGLTGPLCFGGFVAGLGNALLSARRPSWRLVPLPDNVANGLRFFPFVMAAVMVTSWLANQFYSLLDTSLATTVAMHCILSLCTSVVMVLTVMRGRRLRTADTEQTQPARAVPFWLQLAAIAVWLLLLVSMASLLLGYVAFGSYMLRQVVWGLLVIATAYLLSILVVDVCEVIKGPQVDDHASEPVQTMRRVRHQATVLASGVLRMTIIVAAVLLALAPVGEGPVELFKRGSALGQGLSIGEVSLRPGLVLQVILVLLLGGLILRLLMNWLRDSLLPTTRMDVGMRTSVLTLANYVGMAGVIGFTLSAVGISLQGIAWVASALSVGIGFGLQAVVQNFVSGLILLAERPVKVGDWVKLNDVEGDVRRINVRATEIQLGDRSTVIVPNSEFITKAVRNVTLANPMGRVQVLLPMPLDTDAAQVRELLLAAMTENEAVARTPEPTVALEGLDVQGRLMFTATCYVDSPRKVYNVRSELWFTVLERLGKAQLPLNSTQRMELHPAAGVPAQGETLLAAAAREESAPSA